MGAVRGGSGRLRPWAWCLVLALLLTHDAHAMTTQVPKPRASKLGTVVGAAMSGATLGTIMSFTQHDSGNQGSSLFSDLAKGSVVGGLVGTALGAAAAAHLPESDAVPQVPAKEAAPVQARVVVEPPAADVGGGAALYGPCVADGDLPKCVHALKDNQARGDGNKGEGEGEGEGDDGEGMVNEALRLAQVEADTLQSLSSPQASQPDLAPSASLSRHASLTAQVQLGHACVLQDNADADAGDGQGPDPPPCLATAVTEASIPASIGTQRKCVWNVLGNAVGRQYGLRRLFVQYALALQDTDRGALWGGSPEVAAAVAVCARVATRGRDPPNGDHAAFANCDCPNSGTRCVFQCIGHWYDIPTKGHYTERGARALLQEVQRESFRDVPYVVTSFEPPAQPADSLFPHLDIRVHSVVERVAVFVATSATLSPPPRLTESWTAQWTGTKDGGVLTQTRLPAGLAGPGHSMVQSDTGEAGCQGIGPGDMCLYWFFVGGDEPKHAVYHKAAGSGELLPTQAGSDPLQAATALGLHFVPQETIVTVVMPPESLDTGHWQTTVMLPLVRNFGIPWRNFQLCISEGSSSLVDADGTLMRGL